MSKGNRQRKRNRPVQPQVAFQPSSPPIPLPAKSNLRANDSKESRLAVWGKVLTPLATILTLVFAAYQAYQAGRKEQLAAETLSTARAANEVAMQSSNLVEQAKSDLKFLDEKQKEMERLILVSSLAVRAENGDRAAFLELNQLAEAGDASIVDPWAPVSLAVKNARRILRLFMGDTVNDEMVRTQSDLMPPEIDATNWVPDFTHMTYWVRAQSASTAARLRINRLLPNLFQQAYVEPDLHSLHQICISINQLLGERRFEYGISVPHFVFNSEGVSNAFNAFWAACSEEMLSHPPLLYFYSHPTNNTPAWIRLIDPEVTDTNTGLPLVSE